uniref:Uncharacterized protein n=1 Tax=Arundo donax TaxID=35708 RepID=A0A0A9C4T1_ARUDO
MNIMANSATPQTMKFEMYGSPQYKYQGSKKRD